MYLYFNSDDKLVALMPTTRGRTAANHTMRDVYGVELSVSVVPQEIVEAENASAKSIKTWVAEHDPEPSAGDRIPHTTILAAALAVVAETLPEDSMRGPRDIARTLVDAFNDNAVTDLDKWTTTAANLLQNTRKSLNAVMNDRRYGWFIGGPPAHRVAAEARAAENEEPVTYGFERMAGPGPKLGVVDADDEPADDGEHGVFYPKADATYIINPQIENLFNILEKSSQKCPQNVNLIGPHGCGKTELAIQFAARHNRPLLIMDCANLREARDWFGYKTAREGTVFWHESQFVRAVQSGNHVILLDELNRANPNLLNTLMPILDARRFTYLEERGDKIMVGPGTVFFASMNEGAGYTGTSSLDRAIRDRFPRAVELTYLEEADEIKLLINRCGVNKDIAQRLVQMANKIRQDAIGLNATLTESLSTRQLIAAAHDFLLGGVDTLQFTITNHFSPEGDDESERVRVQSIIQGKFGDLIAAQAAATAAVGA